MLVRQRCRRGISYVQAHFVSVTGMMALEIGSARGFGPRPPKMAAQEVSSPIGCNTAVCSNYDPLLGGESGAFLFVTQFFGPRFSFITGTCSAEGLANDGRVSLRDPPVKSQQLYTKGRPSINNMKLKSQ